MARRRLSTDNTSRHCSRCGDSLSDPISREIGVGPVCLKKDSVLLAKAQPANYPQALIFALTMRDDMLAPETIEPWHKAMKSLLRCSERSALASTDMTVMTQTGNDLREVIRACDFLCSFEHPRTESRVNVKNSMVQIIRALGYVGLAGVISGEASTSASKIWFENGRVYMTGLGNTSGFRTMRAIPGITSPRFRGDRAPYSAPASSVVAFLEAVQAHWPMYEGDVASITAEASRWLLAQPGPVVVTSYSVSAKGSIPTSSKNGAVITLRSEDAVLKFNWVKGANMFGFMNALKGVCVPKERSYNPATKEWSFLLQHLPKLVETIESQEIFGIPRVLTPEKDLGHARELTPDNLYGANKTRFQGNSPKSTWSNRASYRAR